MINPSSLDLFTHLVHPVTEDKFRVRLQIPKELPYFDGHFPENPVLPGVAIIDFSVEALRTQAHVIKILLGVKSAKYLALVAPMDVLVLECTKLSSDDWQIIWTKENKKVCDLVLSFG